MCADTDENARHVEWLTQATAGDERAWRLLVDSLGGRLLAYVRRIGVASAEAEDVVQETFIRVAHTTARHQGRSAVATWILAIARNVARDHLRRARPQVSRQVSLEDTGELIAAPTETPGTAADAQALWDFALQTLPPRQFEALWLYYAGSQPLAGVARILGLNAVHARVLVHRARRRLAATWPAAAGEVGPAAQGPQQALRVNLVKEFQ